MKGLTKAENCIWRGVNLLRVPQLAAGLACERIADLSESEFTNENADLSN
jgi:hypothetical protein